jgi:8-oxo-dGTP pyrophosphatase MutT (NUDIX family)
MKNNIDDAIEQAKELEYKLVANVLISLKQDDGIYLLLLTRSTHGSYAGTEEPPGGKIDTHETILAGAKREVQEETGIVLEDSIEFLMWGDVESQTKTSRHFVFHARIELKHTIMVDPLEHCSHRWVHIDELEASALRPTLIEVIKKYKKVIERDEHD